MPICCSRCAGASEPGRSSSRSTRSQFFSTVARRQFSQTPRAWLDYLRGGSARDLRRVLQHNDRDLVSLGELCLKLAEDSAVA